MSNKSTPLQVAANRKNAQLSTGPIDTSSTRYNAVKHGLLAQGLTELDDQENFIKLSENLKTQYQPHGTIENFLVSRIALCVIRLQRCCMMEAEFFTECLNPPVVKREGFAFDFDDNFLVEEIVEDPGMPARLSSDSVDLLVNRFQRYETAVENKLYRTLHELERQQRRRQGETIPAPVVGELGIHIDSNSEVFENQEG